MQLRPVTALAILAVLSCSTNRAPDPIRVPDGACERAGARLEVLQCTYSDGTPAWKTPKGTPFADVCLRAAKRGTDFHPECLSRIRNCSEREDRYRGRLCD